MIDKSKSWVAVDLDGTLAYYKEWVAWNSIGAPIPPMVARIREWLEAGKDVRIFTARVATESGVGTCLVTGTSFTVAEMQAVIEAWCLEHLGRVLPVTCKKDVYMAELWDDRCVQVVPNTGLSLNEWNARECRIYFEKLLGKEPVRVPD